MYFRWSLRWSNSKFQRKRLPVGIRFSVPYSRRSKGFFKPIKKNNFEKFTVIYTFNEETDFGLERNSRKWNSIRNLYLGRLVSDCRYLHFIEYPVWAYCFKKSFCILWRNLCEPDQDAIIVTVIKFHIVYMITYSEVSYGDFQWGGESSPVHRYDNLRKFYDTFLRITIISSKSTFLTFFF